MALAVLECCERAVRGMAPDYASAGKNTDSSFMRTALQNLCSKLRVLRSQAAAGWNPAFLKMLEGVHSVYVERVDHAEKEELRTRKLRCMACPRPEHCCEYAVSLLGGGFDCTSFNSGDPKRLERSWHSFSGYYNKFNDDYVDNASEDTLPTEDLGTFSVGKTCLRKLTTFVAINTFVMEICYSINQACFHGEEVDGFYFANEENAEKLNAALQTIQAAVADDKRPSPPVLTDESLWQRIDDVRMNIAGGCDEAKLCLLRVRAEATLKRFGAPENVEISDDEEEDDIFEEDIFPPANEITRKSRRKIVVVDDSEEEDAPPPGPTRKRKKWPSRQRSRRQQNLDPEDELAAPRNEGRDPPRKPPHRGTEPEPQPSAPQVVQARAHGKRRTNEDASSMARQQRQPGERLASRRAALFNLGALQLRLIREGRDDDAAACTAAMFVIQELMTRVDQLAHTA